MRDPEILARELQRLQESGLITEPEKNLRSKIDSISRSIESLLAKQDRLNYQLRQQKRALARKREELKNSKRKTKGTVSEAASSLSEDQVWTEADLKRLDDYLFEESNKILEKLDT